MRKPSQLQVGAINGDDRALLQDKEEKLYIQLGSSGSKYRKDR